MKIFRSLSRLALTASFFGAAFACESTPPRAPEAGAGQTNSSSGGGLQLPSGGQGPVVIGSGGASGSAGAPGSGGATCAATSTKAELLPLDLYVMVDSSRSMNEQTSTGTTKWKAVTDALLAFFRDPNSAGLGIGLKFFPDEQPNVPPSCMADAECGAFGPCDQRKACVTKNTFTKTVTTLCSSDAECDATESCVPVQRCADGPNCAKIYCVADGTAACPTDCTPFDGYCRERDVCTAPSYATPAVPFGVLPDAAPALASAVEARMPDGFTPTGPALTGALQQARERALANPAHKVAVVLVTDGLPGGFIPNAPPASCMPGDIAGVASVLATGTSQAPAIPTFVIGVFGPCDLADRNVMPQANLDTLATSGGTQKAVVISTDQNVTQQLQDALKQARTAAIACQYAIPAPEMGTRLDFKKVNVNFVAGAAEPQVIGYVGAKEKCDATLGGWYYDKDPDAGGVPTQIVVCDQSCSKFQAIQDARVDIAVGCATVVIR